MKLATADATDADVLAAYIREQAAKEAAQTVAEARERAQRITAAADGEVEAIRNAAHEEGDERGRRRAAEVLAVAEVDARREWLRAREALIAAAVDRVRAQLTAFPALPPAGRILAGLIDEAICAIPDGSLRVVVPDGYEGLLDDAVRARMHASRTGGLQFETGQVPNGGVIVETIDGRLRFDNSFEARIGRLTGRLRQLAAEILLGEDVPTRDVV